jgi:hypothetical protein
MVPANQSCHPKSVVNVMRRTGEIDSVRKRAAQAGIIRCSAVRFIVVQTGERLRAGARLEFSRHESEVVHELAERRWFGVAAMKNVMQ